VVAGKWKGDAMARLGEVKKLRGRPRSLKIVAEPAGSVQAIDRGLAVLGIIAQSDGLTLTDLAQRAGLAPSTAHRILASLEAHQFVFHDEERGLWLIGVGASRSAAPSCATAGWRASAAS
jgi:IclR family acetate operon transcriptional repressor